MSVERRLGYGGLAFAAGNLVLAAGNAAVGEPWYYVGAQLVAAVGFGALGGVFATGRADGEVDGAYRRLVRYGAVLLGVAGLALAFVGVVLLVGS